MRNRDRTPKPAASRKPSEPRSNMWSSRSWQPGRRHRRTVLRTRGGTRHAGPERMACLRNPGGLQSGDPRASRRRASRRHASRRHANHHRHHESRQTVLAPEAQLRRRQLCPPLREQPISSCNSWHRSCSRRVTPDENNVGQNDLFRSSRIKISSARGGRPEVSGAPSGRRRRSMQSLATSGKKTACCKAKKRKRNDRDQILFKVVLKRAVRNKNNLKYAA